MAQNGHFVGSFGGSDNRTPNPSIFQSSPLAAPMTSSSPYTGHSNSSHTPQNLFPEDRQTAHSHTHASNGFAAISPLQTSTIDASFVRAPSPLVSQSQSHPTTSSFLSPSTDSHLHRSSSSRSRRKHSRKHSRKHDKLGATATHTSFQSVKSPADLAELLQTLSPNSSMARPKEFQVEHEAMNKMLKKQSLKLESLENENLRLANTNFELSSVLQQLEKATTETIQDSFTEHRCLIVEAANARLRGYLAMKGAPSLNTHISELESRVVELELTVGAQKEKLAGWASISEEVEKELARVGQERDTQAGELSELQERHQELETKAQTLKAKLDEYLTVGSIEEWIELHKEITGKSQHRKDLEAVIKAQKDKIHELAVACEAAEEQVKQAKQSSNHLRDKLSSTERERQELYEKVQANECALLENEYVVNLQAKFDELHEDHKDLEDSSVDIIADLQVEKEDLLREIALLRAAPSQPATAMQATVQEEVQESSTWDHSDDSDDSNELESLKVANAEEAQARPSVTSSEQAGGDSSGMALARELEEKSLRITSLQQKLEIQASRIMSLQSDRLRLQSEKFSSESEVERLQRRGSGSAGAASEEAQREIEELKKALKEMKQAEEAKNAHSWNMEQVINDMDQEHKDERSKLEQELQEANFQLAQAQRQLGEQNRQLGEQNFTLAQGRERLYHQENTIARLEKLVSASNSTVNSIANSAANSTNNSAINSRANSAANSAVNSIANSAANSANNSRRSSAGKINIALEVAPPPQASDQTRGTAEEKEEDEDEEDAKSLKDAMESLHDLPPALQGDLSSNSGYEDEENEEDVTLPSRSFEPQEAGMYEYPDDLSPATSASEDEP